MNVINLETAQTVQAQAAEAVKQGESAENAAALKAQAGQAEQAGQTSPQASSNTEAALGDLLKTYNIKSTSENVRLMQMMLENRLPLDKDTFQRLNQALRLTGSEEKALFLVSQGIPLNASNVEILNSLLEGRLKLTGMLDDLARALSEPEGKTGDAGPKSEVLALLDKLASVFRGSTVITGSAAEPQQQAETQTRPAGQPQPQPIENAQGQGQANAVKPESPAAQAAERPAQAPVSLEAPAQSIKQDESVKQQSEAHPRSAESGGPAQATVTVEPKAAQANAPQNAPTLPNVLSEQPEWTEQQTERGRQPQERPAAGSAQTPPAQADGALPVEKEASRTEMHNTLLQMTGDKPSTKKTGAGDATHDTNRSEKVSAASQKTLSALTETPSLRGGLKELDDFYNGLRERLAQARELIQASGTSDPATQRVFREIVKIQEFLDFTNQIRNQIYVQIPVSKNELPSDSELYVFRDKKKKTRGGQASALISLDTANLGRFEAYIQKNDSSVTCQFRIRDDRVKETVTDHIKLLEDLLEQYRYKLQGYSFAFLDDAFDLLDREPAGEPAAKAEAGKYFIDVRT